MSRIWFIWMSYSMCCVFLPTWRGSKLIWDRKASFSSPYNSWRKFHLGVILDLKIDSSAPFFTSPCTAFPVSQSNNCFRAPNAVKTLQRKTLAAFNVTYSLQIRHNFSHQLLFSSLLLANCSRQALGVWTCWQQNVLEWSNRIFKCQNKINLQYQNKLAQSPGMLGTYFFSLCGHVRANYT